MQRLSLDPPSHQLHLSVTRIVPTLAWSTTIKNPSPMSEASLIAVAVVLCVCFFFFQQNVATAAVFGAWGKKSGMDFCCWLCCSCRSLPSALCACRMFSFSRNFPRNFPRCLCHFCCCRCCPAIFSLYNPPAPTTPLQDFA